MAAVIKQQELEREENLKVAEMEKVVEGEKAKGKEEKAVEEVSAKLEEHKVEEAKVVAEGERAKTKEEEGENANMNIEPHTGVSFPAKLRDAQQLNSLGCRKKKIVGLNLAVYAFGLYADNAMLKDFIKTKFSKVPENPTKELYEAVIDSDVTMSVRLAIVFKGLTMSVVKKNLDDGLLASIKRIAGERNDDLANKMMAPADNSIKLPKGSVIEITRLPGYVLQTKVKDQLISRVESELLCRAYFHLYLGDDAFDKEAKERFGKLMLSLF